jgi:hypothetical protein
MLDQEQIRQIAREVATANLSSEAISTVLAAPFTDSEGVQAIRITIIVKPDFLEKIKGDDTLNTLVDMHARLQKAGEDRFPSVEYATEDELQESGNA